MFLQPDNLKHIRPRATHSSFLDNADTANLSLSYLTFFSLQKGQSIPALSSPSNASFTPLPSPKFISLMSSATVLSANVSRQSHLSAP